MESLWMDSVLGFCALLAGIVIGWIVYLWRVEKVISKLTAWIMKFRYK